MGAVVDYKTLIEQAARRYGVPPEIALAVAQQESGYRQYDSSGNVLRGGAGEYGIFQLMPGTAEEVGVDPTDPNQNIEGGLRYLSKMFALTGNWPDALLAYNAGPGTWQGGPDGPRRTAYDQGRGYSQQVLARASWPTGAQPGEVVTVPGGSWFQPDVLYGSNTTFQAEASAQGSSMVPLMLLGLAAAVIVAS